MVYCVEDSIKDLNRASFYKKLENSSIFFDIFKKNRLWKKFVLPVLTIINYEHDFYNKHSEYSKLETSSIKESLAPYTKDIFLKYRNGDILSVWDMNKSCSKKYVIFCLGISSQKSAPFCQKAYECFLDRGFGVLAFDYRGRGKSSGIFSEKNAAEDMKRVRQYLLLKGITDISVIGHSMGTGVVCSAAKGNEFRKVILLNPFLSASDMVKKIAQKVELPDFIKKSLLALPSYLIPLKNPFNTRKNIKKIKSDILIVHNELDKTIPCEMGQKLSELSENADFLCLRGENHELCDEKIKIALDYLN